MTSVIRLTVGIIKQSLPRSFPPFSSPVCAPAIASKTNKENNFKLKDILNDRLQKYSSNEKGRTQRMASFKKAQQGKAQEEQARQGTVRAAQLAEREAARKNIKPVKGSAKRKMMKNWNK
ncbi:unnamed protein product [Oikopleura dioica]|uniref:Uncharacterized protein n=1 Tax=Oikopleura dioica TaxID=34765 RepID=E4YMN2_OIKDI|nr:unnamed protein product [Oikopleura dioica]